MGPVTPFVEASMRVLVLGIPAFVLAALSAPPAVAVPASATPLCQQEKQIVQPIVLRHLYIPGHGGSSQKAVGIMVAVYSGGQPCFFGYGSTELDAGTPPTRDSIFEIGSVTKTFTGTMLALRQIRKRNSFRARTAVDTSDIPCADSAKQICLQLTNGMQSVTYFELATFTGGLPDFPPNYTNSDYTQAEFIQFLDAWAAPPGGLPAEDVYSNSGYGLLGELLMSFDGYTGFNDPDVFRAQYDEWIKRAIAYPLGMACTGVDVNTLPRSCAVDQELATGYFYSSACGCYEATEPPQWNPLGPSGQLRSTAADMTKYMSAYLGNMAVAGKTVPLALHLAMRLASMPTEVQLSNAPENRQAYSWVWRPASTGTVNRPASFSKDGAISGFSSCVFMARGAQLGVTLMANSRLLPEGSQCTITEAIFDGLLTLQ